MMYNAHALQMMVTANSETADTIGEVLADIQTQGVRATQIVDHHRTLLRSHQLDPKPVDIHAVIKESLALVAHDMRGRQVGADVDLPSTPCIVRGDSVLLQQVLVNLLMNAMDAMADTPPAQRQVAIRSEIRAADIKVRCATPGWVCRSTSTARCSPFVTTKSNGIGIGLTIARKIVDAHGGSIDAYNIPKEARRSGNAALSETPTIR